MIMKLRYDKDHKLIQFSSNIKVWSDEEVTPDEIILDIGMNDPSDKEIKNIINSFSPMEQKNLKSVANEWIKPKPISSDEAAMQEGSKKILKFLNFSDTSMNKITTKVDLKTNEGKVIPSGSKISYGWIPGVYDEAVMFIYWNGRTYTKSNMDAADIEELTNGSMDIRFSKRIQKSIDKMKNFSKDSSKYFRAIFDDHITWTQGKGFNSREKIQNLIKSNISPELFKDITLIGGGMTDNKGKVSWAIMFDTPHLISELEEELLKVPGYLKGSCQFE